MIDRADHWQVGVFFPAGDYQKMRKAGVPALRRTVLELEPRFASNVEGLTDWRQVSLLSVSSSLCPRWDQRGVLLIGDAAHTMTPAAGAGIKYAIEDAVVAANLLTGPLREKRVRLEDLAGVQRKRIWPTRLIQAVGAFFLGRMARSLRSGRPFMFPGVARPMLRVAPARPLFAPMPAGGFWGGTPRMVT